MGNDVPAESQGCRERVSDIIDESKIQIQRFNPFSKNDEQIPYAQPLEENIFKGSSEDERRLNRIIEMQQLKKPAKFANNDGYEYDEKFWKKQNPNAVIQGHWYRRVPHGLSRFYFPGGKRIFVSYFDHGIPIFDECLIVFENGAYYHGGLKNFMFDGFGKYVNEDESVVIEGEWRDGVPVGKGKQKLISQNLITQFDGEFNSEGQKNGKGCSYTIKNKDNVSEVLFEYKGDFENDGFAGNSILKTQKGKYEFEANFNNDRVEVKHLETADFQFEGEFEKNFSNGHGRFRDLKTNSRSIYQGDLHNGMLEGAGSIINEDGSVQKVYWYQGLKLKHFRNFDSSDRVKQMIHRIEQAYQKSSTYTEMTKILADQYKEILNIQTSQGISPRGHHYSYIFEMISKEKTNNIVGASKINQPSPLKHPRKEMIIELDKGKFLYVNCFKLHPNQRAP